MIGLYKTIASLIFWPLWYLFLVPSLIILFPLIYIIPTKNIHYLIRPLSWLYCLFAGQWLIKENFPPSKEGEPYLYLFNHVSMFDPFMLGAFIPHYITAVGAEEIFKYPLWGSVIKKYGAIPIKRSHLKDAISRLSIVEKAIKKGVSFIIAPEGTRTLDGELGVFKKGPFHLAKNTGVTIVPIALIGGLKAKKKNDWRLKPGILKTRFGKPIDKTEYAHLSVEGIRDLVRSRIEKLLLKGEINEINC
tara:strand:- start:492 stop:1232 length:741 start_codon:yes stop_codon:yes gene_type:complete